MNNEQDSEKYTTACPLLKGHLSSWRYSVQPFPADTQHTPVTTRSQLLATLCLTVGTGKAGLTHGYAQRGWRRGRAKGRGCPQCSTRGARGMDIPCARTHTQTHTYEHTSHQTEFDKFIRSFIHTHTHTQVHTC